MIAITKRATRTKSPRQHAHDLIKYLTKQDREGGWTWIGASQTFKGLSDRQGLAYFTTLAGAATTARGSTVHHVVLTWHDEDTVTKQQKRECVARVLAALGARDLDFIAIEHHDTRHQQVHLVVNRVDPSTHKVRQLGGRWPIREVVQEVARINRDYGWDSPDRAEIRNAKWKVDPDTGQVVRNERNDLDMTQGARDGEWAARMRGQEETTADRVYEFRQAWREHKPRNWQEFHELAAEYGLSYHRRGKGAVWDASPPNDTMQTIKASSALELSYRRLAKQYGEYTPIDVDAYRKKQQQQREKQRQERQQQQQDEEFRAWCQQVWQEMVDAGMTPTENEVEMIRHGQIPPRAERLYQSSDEDREIDI